jgi:ATP-binding cassette subfamily F protein 3
VGLVGANGSGKTTLLRLIQGICEPSGGQIIVRRKSSIGVVAQEAPSGVQSPIEAVLAADSKRAELVRQAESASDPRLIGELHTRLADIDAHAAPARAAAILAGLGFDEEAQHRPMDSFSGGWRMRVALAAVLFTEPDLLLLDEPTNHLDLESVMWLEAYLKSYPNTLIIVSHDRNLLTSVADRILHLQGGKLTMYAGGFDSFEQVRLEKQMLAEAARQKQEARRRKMQQFVDRFRAKASKAKQAQSRLKALDRMIPIAQAVSEKRIDFSFPAPPPCPSPLIKLENASVGYEPGRPVLQDLNLSVFAEDRIALLGANGNGKTTLARLLAGQLEPMKGAVTKPNKLCASYFAQDQLEHLNPALTALEQMQGTMPDDPPIKVRGWLGRFGFEQHKADVKIIGLSGGEKTRLVFALNTLKRPNLMILDEPTNHLDVDARKALILGLCEYQGAILLVSHDRHLIETTVDQLWLVKDGTVVIFRGDMDEYKSSLIGESRERRARSADNSQKKQSKKDERRLAAQSRAKIAPLAKMAEQAESELSALLTEKEKIDIELSDPSTYQKEGEIIASLTRRQTELSGQIERAEDAWLQAQAALEQAEADESEGVFE